MQGAILASAIAQDQDYLLADAIREMDKKLASKIRPGVKHALSLLKNGPQEAVHWLEQLI